ncbi:MAG TPA: type II toxin-antitoxin system VapC family toxin [Solirubrobacteraceae bacterium]|nr:type II toxin-antitoxin system VapC family toxin [Solirubrobacteraceae bacterium]
MILVDTSVWVDHLRAGDPILVALLERNEVLAHPWVIGELALGNLRQRSEVISLLAGLPQAVLATPAEVLALIDHAKLSGIGIGYVDAQLLAATKLTAGSGLWTHDRRLRAAAVGLGCAFAPSARAEPST